MKTSGLPMITDGWQSSVVIHEGDFFTIEGFEKQRPWYVKLWCCLGGQGWQELQVFVAGREFEGDGAYMPPLIKDVVEM